MTFKSPMWYWVAVALSAVNLVGMGWAVRPPEPMHATVHAVLAVAFGLWASRLRRGGGGSGGSGGSREDTELPASLEALELEMGRLRQELSETQERLDFAERMLARGRQD